MIKVMSIFGTRPEAIKMAPVVRALELAPNIESCLCVTAQHREMLDQVLSLFELKPDYDLDLMHEQQSLNSITAQALVELKTVFELEQPKLVLVHGDTTTTMAAALAAFYAHIPVYHVEAGLRTHDLAAPFPEEANRCIVGTLASHHFAPTEKNRLNLIKEQVSEHTITNTGNTGIDALLLMIDRVRVEPQSTWQPIFGAVLADILARKTVKEIILVTGHRRENFGEGIADMCSALRLLAENHPDRIIVYPVHRNPMVFEPVYELLHEIDNIHLIDPLAYDAFVYLMDRSDLILTDSGGVQEEAPSLRKPVLVMRTVTERQEAIDAGTAVLVGTNPDKIVPTVESILQNTDSFWEKNGKQIVNPYGDGRASERIVNVINEQYNS